MSNELSEMDQSIIKNMMLTKSYTDIATMLELNVKEVTEFIGSVVNVTGITTWQMKRDLRKPIKRPNRAVTRNRSSQDDASAEAKKLAFEMREQKRVNLAERQNMERHRATQRRHPIFANKKVDYSQLVTIRIDNQTVIYCKPGEEEASKKRFLKHYSKPIDRYKHSN